MELNGSFYDNGKFRLSARFQRCTDDPGSFSLQCKKIDRTVNNATD